MEIQDAFVKAFTKKVGNGKAKLTICAPLTPQLARQLKVNTVCFTPENMPKPEIIETKLKVLKTCPFNLRLEVPAIEHILNTQIEECADWIATQKGTSKKGKPTKMMIEFKAIFTGSALGVFEWIERYGGAKGLLRLGDGHEQQTLQEEPKKKGKRAAAGDGAE